MVTGTLLVCPRCGGCVELLGEAPKPQELDELRCDCGAVLELLRICHREQQKCLARFDKAVAKAGGDGKGTR